jgi:hypothetical protein
MTWKDVAGLVSKVAPALGGALLGPGGAAAGELLSKVLGVESSPDNVLDALKSDPAAIVKLRELESNERIRIQELSVQAETVELQESSKQLQAVNETMRAEAASTNKWASLWRPFWGFVSAIAFAVFVVFVCILAYKAILRGDANAIAMLPGFIFSMTGLFAIPGSILGVASWHRGKMQRIGAGEK